MMTKSLVRRLLNSIRRKPWIFFCARALWRPKQRIYQHFHFLGPINVQMDRKSRFRVMHFGYHVENDLFWAGWGNGYEGNTLKVWQILSEGSEYIFDVGANTGVFALASAACNSSANIVALEPVSRIFNKLLVNLTLNSFNIHPLKIAASDADGEAYIYDSGNEHEYSATLDMTVAHEERTSKALIETAKIDTLKERIRWPRIDLLKIDVEKHEPAVIKGMAQTLKTDRPTILIEVLDKQVADDINKQITDIQYTVFNIDERRGLVPMDRIQACDYRNFLLVANEHWPKLRSRLGPLRT